MFVTEEDYRVVIGEKTMEVIIQSVPQSMEVAEKEAIEEISGYLRPKYDCDAIFRQEGEQRNHQLVMYVCDIALYHTVAAMPQRMGYEVRKERYERAVKWLEGVQAGKIVLDLPLATDDDGDPVATGGVLAFGNGPDRHSW